MKKFALEHFGMSENEFVEVFVNQTLDEGRAELGGKPKQTPEPTQPKQPKKKLSETGYRAGITFGNDMEACKKTPTTNQTPKTPPPTTTSGNNTTFEVLKVTGKRGRTLLTLHSLDGTTDVLVDTMETPKNITLSKEGAAMVYANTQSTTPIVLNQQYIINML